MILNPKQGVIERNFIKRMAEKSENREYTVNTFMQYSRKWAQSARVGHTVHTRINKTPETITFQDYVNVVK